MRTLIRWLLLTSLPADYRTALVGDLDETYESMRTHRGRVRAGLWYLREAISALTHQSGDAIASSQTLGFRQSRMRSFSFVADVRFALRRWRRRPGFAIAAALTLGIGIGAPTAIYSVIEAVLLAPPPWTEPDRLVVIHAVFPNRRANPLMTATWDRGQFSCIAWDALKSQAEFTDVAGLLLAETQARRHEIAVRTALGGSLARVARQLLVEHLFLGAAGAAAGLLLAFLVMQAFVAVAPATLPRVDSLALDRRVVTFALGLSALSLLLFGVAPAIAIARTRTAGVLAEGGREGAPKRFAGHRVIVSGAIALALVLLVGASLLGETLYRLTSRPLGFGASNLAIVSFRLTGLPPMDAVAPTPGDYRSMSVEERAGYISRFMKLQTSVWATHLDGAMARLMAIPFVTAVGGSYSPPLTGARPSMTVRAATSAESTSIPVRSLSVDANYFTAMRIPILRGRALAGTDRIGRVRLQRGAPPPSRNVVISRDLERRLFDGDAVSQQLQEASGEFTLLLNVVGVVEDVRWRGYGDDDLSVCYTIGEADSTINTLVVRAASDPTPLLPAMRAALRDYDPKFVVTETTTLEAALGRSSAEERLRAQLLSMFGGAALLLAAVGLYGLSSRRVANRRREIGVRVALGAQPRDVRRMVLRDALLTTSVGLAIGLPLAYSGSQLTQALLFQVTATAPRTFVVAAVVLMVAALIAAVLPARRAAAIDPIVVLKE